MLINIKTSTTSILYISCTHNMPYAQFAAARKLALNTQQNVKNVNCIKKG